MRPHKSNLDLRASSFNSLGKSNVARKPRSRGKQNQKLVVLGNLNRLLRRNVVRRRIQKPRPLQHPRRISQPHGVPKRFYLAGGGPTGTGAAVEVFERRGV